MARFEVAVTATRVFLIACIAPLLIGTGHAQIATVTDDTSTPIAGVGHDYIHLLSETVNPANGSVSLRIQVPTPKGRGLTLPFAFAYDSDTAQVLSPGYPGSPPGGASWVTSGGTQSYFDGGWTYSVPMVTNSWSTYNCSGTNVNLNADYIFRSPSGGAHALGLALTNTCPSTTSSGDSQYHGSITGSPLVVSDANGTLYHFKTAGPQQYLGKGIITWSMPDYIEDRNGNEITVTQNASTWGIFTWQDTLGRTLASSSGFGPSGTKNTLTFSGLTYQVTWTTTSANATIPYTAQFQVNGDGVYCSFPGTLNDSLTVVSAITLPNAQQYTFHYGSDNSNPSFQNPYGLLNEIDYPTGGSVKYSWKLSDQWAEGAIYTAFENSGNGHPLYISQGCEFLYKKPVVASRQVFYGGSLWSR